MNCLNCDKPNAGHLVDSGLGVAAWNHLHPEDKRATLPICDEVCAYELGIKQGERLRDAAMLRRSGRRPGQGNP